jgi:hypothetical protein
MQKYCWTHKSEVHFFMRPIFAAAFLVVKHVTWSDPLLEMRLKPIEYFPQDCLYPK